MILNPVSSYLFANQLRIHYLRWNATTAGNTALLVHGLASNARIWTYMAKQLADADFQLIAPDTRGHGISDKPQNGYSFDQIYQDLSGIIQSLDLEKPLLIGHSWGAQLVIEYAARTQFGLYAPRAIVLVDGGIIQLNRVPGADWESTRTWLTPPKLAGMQLDEFITLLQSPGSKWVPDDDTIQLILANFEIDEQERIYPRLNFEHHMQIVRNIWEYKLHYQYDRVRCPVLMVPARPANPLSTRERKFLEAKEQAINFAQEKIAQLKVIWMENSIHDIPLQRPHDLAIAINSCSNQISSYHNQ